MRTTATASAGLDRCSMAWAMAGVGREGVGDERVAVCWTKQRHVGLVGEVGDEALLWWRWRRGKGG